MLDGLTPLSLLPLDRLTRPELDDIQRRLARLEAQELATLDEVILQSYLNAKGDLITATAANTPALLAAGANNTILIADSSQAAGLRWGTIATASLADGAVTTVKITDDNVTNAKLANMAQAKVKGRAVGAGTDNPTDLTAAQLNAIWGTADAFNPANVVTLGASSDEGRGQMGTTPLKLKGQAALLMYRESADSQGVNLEFLKRRSGTGTVLQSGDQIGSLAFTGADGNTFGAVAARILVEVDGTPGSGNMPGRILFLTSPDGSATPAERMRITASGNVGIGGTPSELLHVVGGNIRADAVTAYLELRSTDVTGRVWRALARNDAASNIFALRDATAGADRLVMDTSGKVNLGTSLPTGKLQVTGSLGNWYIDSTGSVQVFTRDAGNYFDADGAAGYFNFITGGNIANDANVTLRLLADRSVLIPNGNLRVIGTLLIDGDNGGVAGMVGLTDQSNTSANSTGVGTVKMKGTTSRDSVGFIKLYNGTTAIWIPYWTTITG
jgi:hypothetical protein